MQQYPKIGRQLAAGERIEKRFIKYVTDGKREFDGIHIWFAFPNYHGASVARHECSAGGKKGYYEVAALDKDGNVDLSVTNGDVAGWLSLNEVHQLLHTIINMD